MASFSSSSTFTTHILSLSFIFFMLSEAPPSVKGSTLFCDPVLAPLFPCFARLFIDPQQMMKPSKLCCLGISSVSVLANTALGKPMVCQCLETLMHYFPIITPQKANNATTQCGISHFVFPEVDAGCVD